MATLSVCLFLWLYGHVLCVTDYPPCDSQSDCKSNECCINKVRPIGRRELNPPAGYCLPLGVENSFCYVRYGSATAPPDHLVFGCPCTSPLVCKGSGKFDIPLGEIGNCTKKEIAEPLF